MTLKFHQALHGYSEGHRQLACSATLSPRDSRLMLIMSDVSGPGIAQTGVPYLTGYPLTESGFYALSKTWPASELPRPGCVWTHTLLIKFADLASLEKISALASLFQRPTQFTSLFYQREGIADFAYGNAAPFSDREIDLYVKLATALYEYPSEQVWARRSDDVDIDDVVLFLWEQQWPRLRRSFKFCTLTTRDRSQDLLLFDLQLTLGGSSSTRLRMASTGDGLEAMRLSDGHWMNGLVRDVEVRGDAGLRKLLREVGADVLGGREAMLPMCIFNSALSPPAEFGIPLVLKLIHSVPPLSGSNVAKSIVFRHLIEERSNLTDESIFFLLEHLHLLTNEEFICHADRICQVIWRSDPRALLALTRDADEKLHGILATGSRSIDMNAVIRALPKVADLPQPLLNLFPSLVVRPEFWSTTQAWPGGLSIDQEDVKSLPVFRAILQGLRADGAINSALHMVGSPFVLLCAQTVLDEDVDDSVLANLERWVRFACNDLEGVATFLAHGEQPTRSLLHLIAGTVLPDAVPNDYGVDPWLHALEALQARAGSLPLDLVAYGCRRALGWRSKSSLELLILTFEPIHNAALKDALPDEIRVSLESSLPWTSKFSNENLPHRLRQTMARRIVTHYAPAELLFSVAADDELFMAVLHEIGELWDGTRYLRATTESMPQRASKSSRLKKVRDFVKRL